MKANEVLKILRISRQTLSKYVKEGKIEAVKGENGQYHYKEESVYNLLNKDVPRKTYIYARVSSHSQKTHLDNQIEMLKTYCFSNGYQINGLYSDIASGISFEKRKEFFQLLDEVLSNRVKRVIISYKDRLSRVGFEFFSLLFEKFGCEIVVVSEVGSSKLDSQEIFEEIISLLHCYSMKFYSKRRLQKIKEVLEDETLNN